MGEWETEENKKTDSGTDENIVQELRAKEGFCDE